MLLAEVNWVAVAAAGSVVGPVVYALFTWRLLLQNQRAERNRRDPKPIVFAVKRFSKIKLAFAITNPGESEITDVKITPSTALKSGLANSEDHWNGESAPLSAQLSSWNDVIPVVYSGETLDLFSVNLNTPAKIDWMEASEVYVDVTYRDEYLEKRSRRCRFRPTTHQLKVPHIETDEKLAAISDKIKFDKLFNGEGS